MVSNSAANSSTSTDPRTSDSCPCNYTQEFRFAVVLYGGVSLCIYMNGVVQELLRLVRASAKCTGGGGLPLGSLRGTERVYREMSQMLCHFNAPTANCTASSPIRTRFVIDILSGSSAGGINGVYLAKALATGQKDMEGLKKLWLLEGDFEKLLLDEQSGAGVANVGLQTQPESFLNGHRMLRKLLDALEGLKSGPHEGDMRLVDEVDLFVTTTDLDGIPTTLKIANTAVDERRHQHVFHFRHDDKQSDFDTVNDPLLAFSARCTSSFPAAFVPARLDDLHEVLLTIGKGQDLDDWIAAERKKGKASLFYRMFEPYFQRDPEAEDKVACARIRNLSFSDGGDLDNKPFEYATKTLRSRRASLPIKRKLLFVEPNPERPLNDSGLNATAAIPRPDILESVYDAALKLPTYETIREDIQKLEDQNRQVKHIENIIEEFEKGLQWNPAPQFASIDDSQWRDISFTQMLKDRGLAYAGYHRLKVTAVTDELAETLASSMNLDLQSDESVAVRQLVREWRETRYTADPESKVESQGKTAQMTQNALLSDFDVSYRVRRLDFIHRKIDRLSKLDSNALTAIGRTLGIISVDKPENMRLLAALEDEGFRFAFQSAMLAIKEDVKGIQLDLEQVRSKRQEPNTAIILISSVDLKAALKESGDKSKLKPDTTLRIESRLASIRSDYSNTFADTLGKWEAVFKNQNSMNSADALARRLLRYFYDNFDAFDAIVYPITYGTELGESVPVDIIRVSPCDAAGIVNEAKHCCRKLAGTELSNFSAFLDEFWRVNDMLWGRLDAAEQLIRSILPAAQQDVFVAKAHAAIFNEECEGKIDHLQQLFCDAALRAELCGDSTLVKYKEILKAFVDKLDMIIVDAADRKKYAGLLNLNGMMTRLEARQSQGFDSINKDALLRLKPRALPLALKIAKHVVERRLGRALSFSAKNIVLAAHYFQLKMLLLLVFLVAVFTAVGFFGTIIMLFNFICGHKPS